MDVTRDVILDLLPLYLANEVSADTRALVEEYLETDRELADTAKQSAAIDLSEDIPVPLTKEDKMKAYTQARRLMLLRTIVLAVTISVTLLGLLSLALLAVYLFR